jgi:hypothetical protein
LFSKFQVAWDIDNDDYGAYCDNNNGCPFNYLSDVHLFIPLLYNFYFSLITYVVNAIIIFFKMSAYLNLKEVVLESIASESMRMSAEENEAPHSRAAGYSDKITLS